MHYGYFCKNRFFFRKHYDKKNVFLGKKTDTRFVVGKNDKEKQKQNHYPEIG